MDLLFSWLPMPTGLDQESWEKFLAIFSAVFLVLLLATVAVALLGYRASANRRRIFRHTDVFAFYSPLKWLWAAVGGAFVTGIACGVTYKGTTGTYSGMFPTCSEFFLLMLLFALAASYLGMAFGPFTPRRFKYRASALVRSSGSKSRS